MVKGIVGVALVVMATASLVGATVYHSAPPTTQKRCESEYAAQLEAFAHQTTATPAPHCTTMTDSQWMQINEHTEALRLQAVR